MANNKSLLFQIFFFSLIFVNAFFIPPTFGQTLKTSGILKEADPYQFHNYPEQEYQNFYFGEIKPAGWIKEQIQQDLDGFIGQMDELSPAVLKDDDIYGENRRSNSQEGTDVSPNALAWWNSESQSNWRDGYLRSAILVEDREHLQEVEKYVEEKLATQEEDGYLGIYAEDLRFLEEGENADFWTQASLTRGLLAYYEHTKNPEILKKIEKAIQLSMQAYPVGSSTPFKKPEVGHSLILTDVLDRLHQITGNKDYLDYSVWLYEDYNKHRDTEDNFLAPDILLSNILDPEYKLKGHGVHAYELFRSLITSYYATGNPVLEKAIEAYREKIALVESPSGGPAGDEWIGGRTADATNVGYEYCSIHELLDSYNFLLQKSGDIKLADKIEWLLFNAGQGARHPDGNAIAYCKTDNSYSMTGPLHMEEGDEPEELRFKYSPVHQDVAVCCAPNAGRIYPYYIQSMWLRKKNGILATLYGPNVLETEINGISVTIHQETNYPFENEISFKIEAENPVAFDLSFRKPEWAEKMTVDSAEISEEEIDNNLYTISREWKTGDIVKLSFETPVKINEDRNGDKFVSRGALLYALPIAHQEKIYKEYEKGDFEDTFYEPVNSEFDFLLPNQPELIFKRSAFDENYPWKTVFLEGKLKNPTNNKMEEIKLVPLGATLLRRLTFPSENGY